MKVTLVSGPHGIGYELFPVNQRLSKRMERETGNESVYFQTDWDWPPLASTLGWNIRSAHRRKCANPGSTDGTIRCQSCGVTPGEFIRAAIEFLDQRTDTTIVADVDHYFERALQ